MLRPLFLLISCSLPSLAGLKDGEVVSNNFLEAGSTTFAAETLTLTQGNVNGVATLNGSMGNMNLSANALIDDDLNSTAAFASSRVDFADRVTITAPGVAAGQPIHIRLAFNVTGSVSDSASSGIRTIAQAIVQGPSQTWRRESNNYGDPTTSDPTGRVEFDFALIEGSSSPNNILLTAALQTITGLPGSIYGGNYFGNPSASIGLSFIEVVSVKDQFNTTLPIWSLTSESLFPYGQGNGTPVPTDPTLSMEPLGTTHYRFTWPTSELEIYELQSSIDGITWDLEATIEGDDLPALVDLPIDGPLRLYRLEYSFTFANP